MPHMPVTSWVGKLLSLDRPDELRPCYTTRTYLISKGSGGLSLFAVKLSNETTVCFLLEVFRAF